jgi:hypothetical protein
MKATILGLLFVIINMQWAFPENSSAEQEFINLCKDKLQWMSEKNSYVLANFFHPKAVFVHMGGSRGTEQELNITKGAGILYKKTDIHNVSVNIIDNTAILLNRITLLAEVGGYEITDPFIVTEVYINEKGNWKLGSLSFTRVNTPGGQ